MSSRGGSGSAAGLVPIVEGWNRPTTQARPSERRTPRLSGESFREDTGPIPSQQSNTASLAQSSTAQAPAGPYYGPPPSFFRKGGDYVGGTAVTHDTSCKPGYIRSCVLLPKMLSIKEVVALCSALQGSRRGEDPLAREGRRHLQFGLPTARGRAWQVVYLHTGGWFERVLPGLRRKLLASAYRVDREHSWGLVCRNPPENEEWPPLPHGAPSTCLIPYYECLEVEKRCRADGIFVRSAEWHSWRSDFISAHCPTVALRNYADSSSLVAVELLLSDPEIFEGGNLINAVGGLAELHCGDVVVWQFDATHRRQPLSWGRRESIIVELWRGPEPICPHRCLSVRCPMMAPRIHKARLKHEEQVKAIARQQAKDCKCKVDAVVDAVTDKGKQKSSRSRKDRRKRDEESSSDTSSKSKSRTSSSYETSDESQEEGGVSQLFVEANLALEHDSDEEEFN